MFSTCPSVRPSVRLFVFVNTIFGKTNELVIFMQVSTCGP